MAETQDTEITLGTGRLLGLFFGLVIVCAVFFGLGFSLGRNSAKTGSLTMEEPPGASTSAQPASTVEKTAAGTRERVAPPPISQPVVDATQASSTPATPTTPAITTPAPVASVNSTAPPEMNKAASISPNSGSYSVQVAAVSKQEDADALVDALKKKSYPVFVATAASDKLFHVQVGPFGDIKDAEAMKAKLLGDGYNPIVKR